MLSCGSAESLTRSGLDLQSQGKLEQAIRLYSKAIQKDKTFGPAWHNRGTAWYLLGEADLALQDLNTAEKYLLDSSTLYNKSSIYLQYGLYEPALRDINKTLELGLTNQSVINNRGSALSGEGEWMEAFKDFNYSLKLQPDYAPAYNNRGVLFFKANNLKQAIKDFSKAIELDPEEGLFYYNRGLAYYAHGDAFEALEDLNLAKKKGYGPAADILEKL